MAFNRQAFARVGGVPDLGTLAATLRPTLGDPFYLAAQLSSAGVVTVFIDKPTAWSGPDIVTVQAAVQAAAASSPQTDAQNQIDGMPIFEKAILLTLLDQVNTIRNLLPIPLPPITPAQAAAAVRTKAGTL